jgi:glycerophosphoryl diester phosphodiesterase
MHHQVPVDFMPGTSYSDPLLPEAGRRLATLDEVHLHLDSHMNLQVLEEFPETQVNIDLKDEEAALVAAVAAVVRAQGAEGRVVWGNFSRWTTERCHEADPSVGLFFSLPSFLKLYLLFYTGLLPFLPLKETHLEIPMPSIFYNEKYRTAVGNVGLARLPLWVLRLADSLIMAPRLFRHLAARGVPTYLWVLNTEEEYTRAFALGAAGVMTDHPSRLQSFLAKKSI